MTCQCKYYLRDNTGQLRCVQCGQPPRSKEVLLPSNKGGRPKKDIPLDRIKALSKAGMGVKTITSQLQSEGYDISAMTVSRALKNVTCGEGANAV